MRDVLKLKKISFDQVPLEMRVKAFGVDYVRINQPDGGELYVTRYGWPWPRSNGIKKSNIIKSGTAFLKVPVQFIEFQHGMNQADVSIWSSNFPVLLKT